MEEELKLQTTKSLISKLSSVSEQTRVAALCELRLLTKNDPDIRLMITNEDEGGALSLISDSLYSPLELAQENAAATLLNVSISCKRQLVMTGGVLDSVAYTLSNHSVNSHAAVQSAAATVYSLCVEEEYRGVIGGKRDIVYALIDIVGCKESTSRTIKDGLKAIFGLSLCWMNRPVIVGFGGVKVLFNVVVTDDRVGVVEDATAVIAQLADCEHSVVAFRKVSAVRVLVDLLSPETASSTRIKENAVSALLNLVRIGGEEVGEEIRQVGLGLVFHGLRQVVDSGSDKRKKRARDLINILQDGMSTSRNVDNDDSGSDLYSGPLIDSNNSSFSY